MELRPTALVLAARGTCAEAFELVGEAALRQRTWGACVAALEVLLEIPDLQLGFVPQRLRG